MPKSILYIGGFELPDRNAAAQRVTANGRILTELGYSVRYLGVDRTMNPDGRLADLPSPAHLPDPLTASEASALRSDAHSPTQLSGWHVGYPQRASQWLPYLCDLTAVRAVVERKLPATPAVIIAYNYQAGALIRLRAYCHARRIALVADCTEWYDAVGGLLVRTAKAADTALRMRWLHPKLDGLIAISRYLFDYYGSRMDNVLMLPPLVDAADAKWQPVGEPPSDVRRLVYCGSPGSGQKDRLDRVVSALATLKTNGAPPFRLQIVGITREQFLSAFGADALPAAVRDDLQFAGRLPHREAVEAVKAADFSVFIRDRNRVTEAGFPTKLVESITCGTPVLTNASSNVSEYLVEGKHGFLLDVSSEQALAHSLALALQIPRDRIRAMKQDCAASHLFDYHQYETAFGEFLQRAVEACQGRGTA